MQISRLFVGVSAADANPHFYGTPASTTDLNGTSPTTVNMTLGAENDRVAFFVTQMESTDTADDITALTYGGVSATEVGRIREPTSGSVFNNLIVVWAILEADLPSNGSQSISVTWDSNGTNDLIVWGGTYKDLQQAIPSGAQVDTDSTASGTTVTLAPTTAGVNSSVMGASGSSEATTFTEPSGYEERLDTQVDTSTLTVWGKQHDAADALLSLSSVAVASGRTIGIAVAWPDISTVALGKAVETETALAILPKAVSAIGLVAETDTALSITPVLGASVSIGIAAETDTALAITPTVGLTVAVGKATELDTALIILPKQPVKLGLTTELETALAITPSVGQAVAVGLASELDVALAMTPLNASATVVLGKALETDTALAITPNIEATTTGDCLTLAQWLTLR